MKVIKILGQLSSESNEEFERRIENFVNDGWEVKGLSHYQNASYLKVLLVQEKCQ